MKPKAVLISDIHFTTNTLEVASEALTTAQYRASSLNVPLIICGDTLDSKAIIRAEVANRLLKILKEDLGIETYILVGNHDLINERSKEHALNFLDIDYCYIIDKYEYNAELRLHMIPYMHDKEELKATLSKIPKGSTIIMHQGVMGAHMGHYVQDTSSLPPEVFKDFRIISGHYHKAQDIKTGDSGMFSYVGNPYTLSFAEANDPDKGYCILNSDGSLTRVPLNLRKHVIIETSLEHLDLLKYRAVYPEPTDIIWLKVTGSSTELDILQKNEIGRKLFGHSNFKLDKIPHSLPKVYLQQKNQTDAELLDQLIDITKESEEIKSHLKTMWREVLDGTFKSNGK